MKLLSLVCLVIVVLGIVLFLYGSNYYDNTIGWTGIYLFFGGIVAYVLLRVLSCPAKSTPAPDQKP
jgi:hypothetical protein